MPARLLAIVIVVAAMLPGCQTDDGPRDSSYASGPDIGKWQPVRVGDTVLGTTDAVAIADWAFLLQRPSDFSEVAGSGDTRIMYDQAFPPYLLRRLLTDEMAEAIHASFSRGAGRPRYELGTAPFQPGPASFGTLHYRAFTHAGRPCVAFVQQWPSVGLHPTRMARRLVGVLCDTEVDTGGQDIVSYVTTSYVPAIVDQLR